MAGFFIYNVEKKDAVYHERVDLRLKVFYIYVHVPRAPVKPCVEKVRTGRGDPLGGWLLLLWLSANSLIARSSCFLAQVFFREWNVVQCISSLAFVGMGTLSQPVSVCFNGRRGTLGDGEAVFVTIGWRLILHLWDHLITWDEWWCKLPEADMTNLLPPTK